MRPRDLRNQLQQQPFRPFRLHMTDGTVFDVAHPELAAVGDAVVRISLPPALGLERDAVIDLLRVMWLEVPNIPAPAAPAGPGNGQPPPPP